MTYIFPAPCHAPQEKSFICRSCSHVKKTRRHDLHLRARQAFSWAPRFVGQRLKNNDYMTDMTYKKHSRPWACLSSCL